MKMFLVKHISCLCVYASICNMCCRCVHVNIYIYAYVSAYVNTQYIPWLNCSQVSILVMQADLKVRTYTAEISIVVEEEARVW